MLSSVLDAKVNIQPRHELAVELEEWKRKFLMAAHTPADEECDFHVFDDVACFSQSTAYCHSCRKTHPTCIQLDVLWTGPSCKDVSKENADKSSYADCCSKMYQQDCCFFFAVLAV